MTDTVISSATREIVIGFDRPFVIIGERINPTGRKLLAAEMVTYYGPGGSWWNTTIAAPSEGEE